MAKRPHPNEDQRPSYVKSLVIRKAATSGGNGGKPYVPNWSLFPGHLIVRLVWAANIQGSSVLFGQTRNGHTYTLSLFAGTDKANWYFEATDEGIHEFSSLAESIIEAAMNTPEAEDAPFLGD